MRKAKIIKKNWERYKYILPKDLDKKGISYFLLRFPSDKKIIPIISQFHGKKICDVGCGTGYYTKILAKNNYVIGIEKNPHLSKNLKIKVIKGDAINFSKKLREKFDIVFSAWMTEYLKKTDLLCFFKESQKVLLPQGKIITTIISDAGFGKFYTFLAKKIKEIDKYCYSLKDVSELLIKAGFKNTEIIELKSWLSIPWAFMIISEKEKNK